MPPAKDGKDPKFEERKDGFFGMITGFLGMLSVRK
jgi:hypothetical protein